MPVLLKQLLHDLHQRYQSLRGDLAATALSLPAEVLAYRDKIQTRVDRSIGVIEDLLLDPDLSQPLIARNIFHLYKRLSELAQAVDEGPVFVLSRFGPPDVFLTRLVAAMCGEFGFPYTSPLCAAMSTQYYFAVAGMDLILVPHSESSHLLGLPDIYHELGHFILFRDTALLPSLRNCVDEHFRSEVLRAQSEGWPAKSVTALERYRTHWLGEWIIEFGCDLLATTVCGPAFGWANARLCARLSADFHEIMVSHPADAARTVAIRLMLQHLGFISEASQIDDQWQSLYQISGQQEPQEFRLAFPASLLSKLVEQVTAYCGSVGIRSYKPNTMPVARLLNQAWSQFLSDPISFDEWEKEHVGKIIT
jgi:hypothetical protein